MKLPPLPRQSTLDWLEQIGYTTLRLFFRNSLQNHAAATAFYFMLSATPLLLLLSYAMQWLGKLAETYVPATMLFAELYNQLHLEMLTEVGFLPRQTRLAAGGVGVLTLLLSSRGMVNAVQSAFKVIFPADIKRRLVTSWLLPLIIIPVALGLLGLAGIAQTVLSFFSSVELIGGLQATLLKIINAIFVLLMIWLLVFLAYWRLPIERPKARETAIIALLASISLFLLFALFGHFFQLEKYKSLYGALGGAVFVLIGAYFACIVFYLWAQCLFAVGKVDVEALEKLFLRGEGYGANKLEAYVFGRANRLLERYGKSFSPGDTLIEEGDQSETAFFLYAGEVGIYKNTETGERKLGTLSEGELFGEMAYLLKEKRTATVRAESDVVVLALPPNILEDLMRHSAHLSRRIIDTLCQRLEKMNLASGQRQ
ncbi:MAG: YihY/virulence factor BrkB family protein [Hydrogenophilaceae bacterium]|nr:YihY/virulence factor BrkB family protein [Hydrogenophilaceae bacterium]